MKQALGSGRGNREVPKNPNKETKKSADERQSILPSGKSGNRTTSNQVKESSSLLQFFNLSLKRISVKIVNGFFEAYRHVLVVLGFQPLGSGVRASSPGKSDQVLKTKNIGSAVAFS